MSDREGFGRRVPTDWTHAARYPFTGNVVKVERVLALPAWHDRWIQGQRNSCVGHATSLMLSILNRYDQGVWREYSPWWLWDRSKERDEWADTNPGDNNGTSVNAACQVLHRSGHVVVWKGKDRAPDKAQGIAEYRWATNVDSIRASLSVKVPVSFAIGWNSGMDRIETRDGEAWYGVDDGYDRGGHDVCLFGASDRRQAFKVANSWQGYPPAWLAYAQADRLLARYGEACLVTDLATGRIDPQRRRREDNDERRVA